MCTCTYKLHKYFQLLKEFQENMHSYCAYKVGVHAFLKSDLIVEVMYNGKDITFLGPHVCYTCTYSIMETFVMKSKIPKVIVND